MAVHFEGLTGISAEADSQFPKFSKCMIIRFAKLQQNQIVFFCCWRSKFHLLAFTVQMFFCVFVVFVMVSSSREKCNVPLYEMHASWLAAPFALFTGLIVGLFGSEYAGRYAIRKIHFHFKSFDQIYHL